MHRSELLHRRGYDYAPNEQNLAESWNGTSWTLEPSSNRGGDQQLPQRGLLHRGGLLHGSRLLLRQRGRAQSRRELERHSGTLEPSSNPAGATSSYLNAVSCTAANSCTAVGYDYVPNEQNLAKSWNGTSWTLEPSSNPAGATSSYLNAVSCTAANSGTAVGYDYAPNEQNLAESWNGTSWTLEPSSNPAGATNSYLNAVSCTAANSCTAVGYDYAPNEQNLAES